jgi:UDP-glucose 4-epimerase
MRILVTGAAGFVGSHAALVLHLSGHDIVATDRVELESARSNGRLINFPECQYVQGELSSIITQVMRGIDEVWHFAANADIPLSARDTAVDMRESILLTQSVLESMREFRVPVMYFPSSGAVYGNGLGPVARESDGPLLPCSLYAAAKLACEGMVSAYAHLFGLRCHIFRFGNLVGGAMRRGIVWDFIGKLHRNSLELTILGDGGQRKSYVLVEDVIAGMRWIGDHLSENVPASLFNLAAGDSLDVRGVVYAVAEAMGIAAPRIKMSSEAISWPGDQPVIELSIERAISTGWKPNANAYNAVRVAAERLLEDYSQ